MADPPDRPDPAVDAEGVLLAAGLSQQVAAAVAALPPRQRDAVILCHYQELSNIEAAELVGVSVETIESLLSRGRRALKAALLDLAPNRGAPTRKAQG